MVRSEDTRHFSATSGFLCRCNPHPDLNSTAGRVKAGKNARIT